MLIYPTIRQLQIFLVLSEAKSFSRAAIALRMSQSALSQSIKQLEFLLNIKLIERTKRSFRLTVSGEKLRLGASTTIDGLGQVIDDIKTQGDPNRGTVKVGCLTSVAFRIMPAVLDKFRRKFPSVSVTIREDDPIASLDGVKSGTLDFAVSILLREDGDVEFMPVLQDTLHFICRSDHPYNGRRQIEWRDIQALDSKNLVVVTRTGDFLNRALLHGDYNFGATEYDIGKAPTALRAVEEYGFVSFIPGLTLPLLKGHTGIHECPIVNPVTYRSVGMITRRNDALSSPASAFRAAVLETIQELENDLAPHVTIKNAKRRAAGASTPTGKANRKKASNRANR